MNKKIASLISIFLIVNGVMGEGLAEPLTALTYRDHEALEALYWHDSNGFLHHKLSTINVDYYLQVLPKHIKEMEKSLTAKRSGWISPEMFCGVFSALAAATLAKFTIVPDFHRFMAGKFSRVEISDSMLDNLAAINFTDAEKRKLQSVEVESIYLSSERYSTRFNYSQEELEKIKLLAHQLANKQAKIGLPIVAMMPAILAFFSGWFFYEAAHYVENTNKSLTEKLERAESLFELLKKEQNSRFCRSRRIA